MKRRTLLHMPACPSVPEIVPAKFSDADLCQQSTPQRRFPEVMRKAVFIDLSQTCVPDTH
jgi:hypothetical protein